MIEFANAGFSYGSRAVLRDVTLMLAPGSMHVLLGPSGAGKTTLLRLCHAALAASSGTLRHFGKRVAPRNRRAVADLHRVVSLLPQEAPFLDHLSLVENVCLPLVVSGIDPATRAKDVKALLDWVDLGARRDTLPGALNAAELRRAALARAVVLSPQMLIADEPTGGLDPDRADQIVALLAELHGMGMAMLVATHDPQVAAALISQTRASVLQLTDGRLASVKPRR